MPLSFTWIWIFPTFLGLVELCPDNCTCGWTVLTTLVYLTNCSHLDLYSMPLGIPLQTHHLDLTHNRMEVIFQRDLQNLTELRVLDTRWNPKLVDIQVPAESDNLTLIHTDRGSTCCKVELKCGELCQGKLPLTCDAVEPYTECNSNLLQVSTLVLYGIIIIVSIVINTWVIVVTLGTTKRRLEPFQLNYMNFAIADLMITVYATVMFSKGIAYYGTYPAHMDDWTHGAGCSMIGYLLITGSFLLSFFYMISVVAVHQAVTYSLNTEKQLSMKHLGIALALSWALSLLLGAIPFMTEKSYDMVGSCLPFYASEVRREYSYVVLYTVVITIGNITNTTLGVIMLCVFAKWRKVGHGDGHQGLEKENNAIRVMITSYMILHILLTIVTTILLVLSCVGGEKGMIGREWLIRVYVLQTILWPIVGPMRKKTFYRESLRLLQKWNCYDWDKRRISLISSRRPTNPPSRSHIETEQR